MVRAGGGQVARCSEMPSGVVVYGAAVDVGMRMCGPLFYPLCKLTQARFCADSSEAGHMIQLHHAATPQGTARGKAQLTRYWAFPLFDVCE